MNQEFQMKIAEAFSNGKFELAYSHMANDITWRVVGENIFEGEEAVVANCEQTAAYFRSVTTLFEVKDIISEKNKTAITGTAEFIRNNKRVAFVEACDVYVFNEEGKLQTITSYCIQERK